MAAAAAPLQLGAVELTAADYRAVVAGERAAELAPAARERMERHRAALLRQLDGGARIYGVNTGYGADSVTELSGEEARIVQRNTLLSHAVGTGRLADRELVRGMLLLKANVLARGYSAVRPRVVELLLELLAHDIVPLVPEQGSLAASGDLVPQGHLGQALIGAGEVDHAGRRTTAAAALAAAGLTPLAPEEKEGLALVNGTAFTTAFAFDNVERARRLVRVADVVAALTLQALKGFPSACDERVVASRPHPGAHATAANVRALCAGAALLDQPRTRVHDPYCLRCLPQIHGASRDALAYVEGALAIELDGYTDNPLVLCEDGDEWISGGNFHAQPIGLPMDTLTVAVAELASVSQRRTHHLVAPIYDVGLPDKLSRQGARGIGMTMVNITAAALVSENKALSFPATVDSIAVDTTEDHVSMGSVAARKARDVIANTARVLALELVCACQALDLHGVESASPAACAVVACVRETVPFLDDDRSLSDEVERLAERVLAGAVDDAADAALAGALR